MFWTINVGMMAYKLSMGIVSLCILASLLESTITARPSVSVKPLGGSRYLVIYEIDSANQEPTSAEATVINSSVVEFTATVGSHEFHHVSDPEPAGIRIIEQRPVADTYRVKVECPVDPTDKFH
ncbi:uncharacterized protein LOC124270038 [Haliotis rubra]|uniref:uncharacterized protein LOC124270038 n=1 Tax=Haliotis rubra TaxID=36100 RepID=UPI001EE5D04D|nr:uncharacterized protein LOC124270038 [Haliotis rubra]